MFVLVLFFQYFLLFVRTIPNNTPPNKKQHQSYFSQWGCSLSKNARAQERNISWVELYLVRKQWPSSACPAGLFGALFRAVQLCKHICQDGNVSPALGVSILFGHQTPRPPNSSPARPDQIAKLPNCNQKFFHNSRTDDPLVGHLGFLKLRKGRDFSP